MRINGVNKVNGIYKSNKAQKAYSANHVSKGKDTLALSDFAKELQVAKKAVNKAPDIRQTKVDDIKQRMEAGTYNITAAQVADKIVEKQFE